jgi:CRP-like cAMP-binding protein
LKDKPTVRRSRKQRVPIKRTRKATLETLEPLTKKGQIFYRAEAHTLERVVQNSVVRSFEKGDIVFDQGERTDNLPLFCVLSGRFDVIHIWGNNQRHVATEGEGTILGDVELLLRGETLDAEESVVRGLSTDQTWGRIRCAAPSEVLSIWPADFLLEEDHWVAVALARSLAKKLLLRSAVADPKTILSKSKQVELYLRRVAKDLAGNGANPGELIPIPMSLADVAEEVECAKQTVAVALKEMEKRYEGFSHERSLIVVPRRFIEAPLDLFDEEE